MIKRCEKTALNKNLIKFKEKFFSSLKGWKNQKTVKIEHKLVFIKAIKGM